MDEQKKQEQTLTPNSEPVQAQPTTEQAKSETTLTSNVETSVPIDGGMKSDSEVMKALDENTDSKESESLVEIKEDEVVDTEMVEELPEDFKPIVSSKTKREKQEENGRKVNLKDCIVKIKDIEYMPPKMKNKEGVYIPPTKSKKENSNSEWYNIKTKIHWDEVEGQTYEEDKSPVGAVDYYSGLKHWVNTNQDGKKFVNPELTGFDIWAEDKISTMARLWFIAKAKMCGARTELVQISTEKVVLRVVPEDKEKFEEFDATVLNDAVKEFLIGKTVKITEAKGVNPENGKSWFRNDVLEILD